MDEIQLRKVNDPISNSLPRGVRLIIIDNHCIFARRVGLHFIPLPEHEQETLRKKHIQ